MASEPGLLVAHLAVCMTLAGIQLYVWLADVKGWRAWRHAKLLSALAYTCLAALLTLEAIRAEPPPFSGRLPDAHGQLAASRREQREDHEGLIELTIRPPLHLIHRPANLKKVENRSNVPS